MFIDENIYTPLIPTSTCRAMVEHPSSSHHRAPVEQPSSNCRAPSSNRPAAVEQFLETCSMVARLLDDCSTAARQLLDGARRLLDGCSTGARWWLLDGCSTIARQVLVGISGVYYLGESLIIWMLHIARTSECCCKTLFIFWQEIDSCREKKPCFTMDIQMHFEKWHSNITAKP